MGNKQDEKQLLGVVTGHFSYGVGIVIRDPLTQALRFEVDYHQIYAHNNGGIISGRLKRCCYVGDLQRGWLNLRPISDIVIKLDCITQDYHFGAMTFSPFDNIYGTASGDDGALSSRGWDRGIASGCGP